MKTVHVFGNATIYNLGITELFLDNQKRMFRFAPDRRFSVFDFLIPVESCVAGCDLKAGWSDICPEFDIAEMLILLNLRSLFHSAVS